MLVCKFPEFIFIFFAISKFKNTCHCRLLSPLRIGGIQGIVLSFLRRTRRRPVSPLVFKLHAVLEEETKHSEKFLFGSTNYKENKMNPFKRNIVLSLLLSITAFSMVAKAAHVDIYNDLGQGVVTVHCNSNSGNHGSHVLPYPKAGFGFDFDPGASVVIYCTFKLPGGVSHSFDIYRPDRDKCVTCSWLVRAGGPCLQQTLPVPKEDCYPWK
jgi:hypothetical protein